MIVLSVLLCIAGLFSFNFNKLKSDAYNSIPSGTINNLYDETNDVFNINNLNELAQKVNYNSFIDMMKAAEDYTPTTSNPGLKKASDFGTTTVKFGTFIRKDNGKSEDLIWIPTFLSKDNNGDAILTLWLAKTEGEGSLSGPANNRTSTNTVSDQENSTWTAGTFHTTNRKNYREDPSDTSTTPDSLYSNAYDGSFIRHAMLLYDDNYLTSWGQTWSGGPVSGSDLYTMRPTQNLKFKKFVEKDGSDNYTGIAKYLNSPSQMPWQMAENKNRNDPAYAGSDSSGYTSHWVNDNLWLASATEIYSPNLWGMNDSQRSNANRGWLLQI